jgi:hypothetical protein
MGIKIYVASSWRNLLQPAIVHALRRCGHEVYDFRNPAPGNKGFAWSDIDPNWQSWSPAQYREALKHPIAVRGYGYDIAALEACEACVLVLPSGRSASWEFGYAMGQGKEGTVVQFGAVEPELMYRQAEIVTSMDELFDVFGEPLDDHDSYDEEDDVHIWTCPKHGPHHAARCMECGKEAAGGGP